MTVWQLIGQLSTLDPSADVNVGVVQKRGNIKHGYRTVSVSRWTPSRGGYSGPDQIVLLVEKVLDSPTSTGSE